MVIRRGCIVKHDGMQSWGTGMVVDIADFKATIQFSDGVVRKIASSHYHVLVAGDPATFVATESALPLAIKPVASRAKRKVSPAKAARAK